jgi:hypothetical protein
MNMLAGSTVRLEPLATHHTEDLFTELGNDVEAWRCMLVTTPSSLDAIAAIVNRYLDEHKIGIREPFAVIHLDSGRTTDNFNNRSQAAIERLGAKFEGVLRSHKIRPDGTLRDTVYYSIVKAEWPAVKVQLEHMLT